MSDLWSNYLRKEIVEGINEWWAVYKFSMLKNVIKVYIWGRCNLRQHMAIIIDKYANDCISLLGEYWW